MKKTAFFLLLIMLFTAFSHVCADGGSCGENASWTLSDDGLLTVSGTGPMEDYDYADRVPWYGMRNQIKRVIIEEGITTVGKDSFLSCINLLDVSLPESLTAIGDAAFYGCQSLSVINVPEGIHSIGKQAFRQCSNLKVFPIPPHLEAIEDYTFENCIRLGSVTLPETLKSIGVAAFMNCDSLTGIAIPASVSSISEKDAFTVCNNLKKITVDPGNADYVSIDGVLFNKDQSRLLCYPAGKTNASYTVPETVTAISDSAFAGSTNLVSLTIPGSVKKIGEAAFSESKKLTTLTLSEGLKKVGDEAFYNLPRLTEITLPASLTALENEPFYGCESLRSINVAEGSEILSSIDGVLFSADGTVLITYPGTRIERSYAVPEGVEKIGDEAFAYSANLVSVTLPDSLKEIGEDAFYECERLTGITFPKGLETIGGYAFLYCENLAEVTFLGAETDLDDAYGAFEDCAEDLTISGFAGSTAEAYAEENDIPFIELEEEVGG